jgi:hypothetical protein
MNLATDLNLLEKGLKVRLLFASGEKSNWITLEESISYINIYVEARPIKSVKCFYINSEYVPADRIEISL